MSLYILASGTFQKAEDDGVNLEVRTFNEEEDAYEALIDLLQGMDVDDEVTDRLAQMTLKPGRTIEYGESNPDGGWGVQLRQMK